MPLFGSLLLFQVLLKENKYIDTSVLFMQEGIKKVCTCFFSFLLMVVLYLSFAKTYSTIWFTQLGKVICIMETLLFIRLSDKETLVCTNGRPVILQYQESSKNFQWNIWGIFDPSINMLARLTSCNFVFCNECLSIRPR